LLFIKLSTFELSIGDNTWLEGVDVNLVFLFDFKNSKYVLALDVESPDLLYLRELPTDEELVGLTS